VRKKLIGLTGPSSFTSDCVEMVEDFFDADFVLLYHNKMEHLAHWIDVCDGFIVAGGVDIHPTMYSENIWNNSNLSKFDLKRDCREMFLVDKCIQHRKPLLGICRGHQLIGVRYGMVLIADLSGSATCHQPQRQGITLDKSEPMHSVRILHVDEFFELFKHAATAPERKIMREVLVETPNEKLWVNSFHHQGIIYNPKRDYAKQDGVRIWGVARAEIPQVVKEIIEMMQGDTWLSVQFHPEYDWKENSASRAVLERFKEMIDIPNETKA